MPTILKHDDFVSPELNYQLVGCAYDVYNELGFRHLEKYYQRAYAVSLDNKNLTFKEQVYFPLKFKEVVIGRSYFDFLVDEKIIVELKKDNRFSKKHIDQVNEYLQVSNLKLALLINFIKSRVVYLRVLNVNKS